MKLTNTKKKEILKIYDTWLHSYLNGDDLTYDSYFADEYHFIGSTDNEEFLNRKDTTQFFKDTAEQFSGKTDLRNQITTVEAFNDLIFITHLFDAWFINGTEWTYYSRFRFSSVLQEKKEGWKFIYQHFSVADGKADEGETIGFDKVNAENQELREAIQRRTKELEQKNRELEIEACLERIRAEAVAMKASSDLLDIVVTMRNEFTKLGHEAHYFWHMMWLPETYEKAMTSGDGSKIGFVMTLPRHIHGDIPKLAKWEKSKKPTVVYAMDAEEAIDYVDKMVNLGNFKNIDPKAPSHDDLKHIGGLTFVMARTTHGEIGYSLPGIVKNPPKVDLDILVRFAGAFDLAHKRFLDLQKAEAQARETQIELALEKVRSRTMGMQRSDELRDTAMLLFKQVEELGINSFACGFNIWDEDKKAATAWMASKDRLQPPFKTNSAEDVYLLFHEAEKRGESLFVLEQKGKELEDHYKYLITIPEVKKLSEAGLSFPTFQIIHCAYFSKGYLMFITLEPVPDAHDIFERFAKVFEQTYTRFLDLQKAEKQTREKEIELAIEKVRSRTMAMQHSDELQETSFLLDEQVRALGIKTWGCAFHIYGEKESTEWFGNEKGVLPTYTVPRAGIFKKYFEKGKKGETLFVQEFDGKACVDHYEYMSTLPVIGDVLKKLKETNNGFPTYQIDHVVYFKYGYLLFITKEHVPDAHDIFKRFAIVFEQTYTRFLDLQKAEAQAREAQIETALERVRSCTMAMQRSDELSEVILEVLKKLQDLGISMEQRATAIFTYEAGNKDYEQWVASPEYNSILSFNTPYFDHPVQNDIWNARQDGTEFYSKSYTVAEKNSLFKYLFNLPALKNMPQSEKTKALKFKYYNISIAFRKNAALVVVSHSGTPLTEAENTIIQRLSKVFEQTYTRFLDLQKAEAQAKEAQIEAALERVRSRAMAIRSSIELDEVIQTIFQELEKLEMNLTECSIVAYDTDPKDLIFWSAGPIGSAQPSSVKLQYIDHPLLENLFKDFKNGIKHRSGKLSGKILNTWWQRVFTETDFKHAPKEFIDSWKKVESICYSQFAMTHGFLEFLGESPLPEDKVEILKRFTNVIDLTYTRYDDVVKAEAQAREAQIQLSLERVRAKSMAMQSSDELETIIQVVHDQFVDLGITLDHAGFIIDYKKNDDMIIWLADDHKVTPQIRLSYFDSPHWNSFNKAKEEGHKLFVNHLDFKTKNKFYKQIFNFVPELSDEAQSFYLNIPSLTIVTALSDNIGLYIENFSGVQYQEEDQKILSRFTDEFQQAYTRFLDLKKAEAQTKEAKIEAALEKIRSRTMAMQKGEEVKDVVVLLYKELIALGVTNFATCGYVEINEETQLQSTWVTSPGGDSLGLFYLPLTGDVHFDARYKAWKNKQTVFHQLVEGKERRKHLEYAITTFNSKEAEEMVLTQFPDPTVFYCFNFSHGYLHLVSGSYLTEEEEAILARFTKVFEQTYARFLDLEKAEAQTREAQINLSVERVRAKALAMHKSEEIMEVVAKLKEEVMALDIPDVIAATIFLNEGDNKVRMWDLSTLEKDNNGYQIPFDITFKLKKRDPNLYVKRVWENPENYFIEVQEGKDFKRIIEWLRENNQDKIADEVEEYTETTKLERLHHAAKKLNNGKLVIDLLNTPSDEMETILTKMGGAFDLAYKRFEDLQKAEAQTREAQIEAALEKVRSRSLAMHKPDELQEVIAVVAEKLKELGVIYDAGGVILCTYFPDNKDVVHWIAVDDFSTSGRYYVPYFDNPIFNDAWESKIKGDAFFSKEFPVDAKNDFFKQAFEQSDYKHMPKDYKQYVLKADKHRLSAAWSKNSAILIPSLTGAVPSESDAEILKRFAKVFEQAYIRFMDLEKAEAQAKEAKIEAALEKVRSRSLAMQKSDELLDVIGVVSEQVHALRLKFDTICFGQKNKDGAVKFWLTSKGLPKPILIDVPPIKNKAVQRVVKAQKDGLKFLADVVTKKTYTEWNNHMLVNSQLQYLPEAAKTYLAETSGFARSSFFLKEIALYVMNYKIEPFSEADNAIFNRFAQVFDQSYTRFLDLKKAEAQARESQIEAALEKVRSRTMAMQHSDELPEAANNLFLQVQALGIPAWSAGYCIWEENQKSALCHMSSEGEIQKAFSLPTIGEGYNFYDPYKKGETFHVSECGGEDLVKHYDFMKKLPTVGAIFEELMKSGISLPTFQIFHIVYFKFGYVMFITYESVPDAHHIFKRFGQVFEQTYTRFLDLKLKEEQAVKLKEEKQRLEKTLKDLQETQKQLIQSEKMASLGELTAGIAHEIQNPLNFVNNFSEVSKELLEEMLEEIENGDMEEVRAIMDDVVQNLEKINHHGKRADGIVKGMLQHSRASGDKKEPTDINALADEYLRLAYHGLRAKDKSFNAQLVTNFDDSIDKVKVIPQDLGRVILNLLTNAFYVVNEKQKRGIENYNPTVSISTKKQKNSIEIQVTDNGNGMPNSVKEKIFQPFFTTKPTGQGTGLGLSMSYDIITKGHGGELRVESKEGDGTTFRIILPSNQNNS